MQLRRVIGLVAFVASLWIGLIGVRSWRADPNSIGGLVGILLLGGGALFGLLIAITLFFGGTPATIARRADICPKAPASPSS